MVVVVVLDMGVKVDLIMVFELALMKYEEQRQRFKCWEYDRKKTSNEKGNIVYSRGQEEEERNP